MAPFCGLCGSMDFCPALSRLSRWTGFCWCRPLPLQGWPASFMLVGTKTTGTLLLGPFHPFLLSLLLLFIPPPILKLSWVQHFLHFPSCWYYHGPLELHECLMDFGVRDHSTLLLKGKCVLGGGLQTVPISAVKFVSSQTGFVTI